VNADLNCRFERTERKMVDPTCRLCLSAKRPSPHLFKFGPDGHSPFSVCGFHPRPFSSLNIFEEGEEQRGASSLLRHAIKRNPFKITLRKRSPVSLELTKRHRPTVGLSFVSQSNHRAFCLCNSSKGGPEPDLGKISLSVCSSRLPFLTFSGRPLFGDSPTSPGRDLSLTLVFFRWRPIPWPGGEGNKKYKK
jgi:hypothetical protein